MSKRKQYDYMEALNPDHAHSDFIDYKRILRKLVREAVEEAYLRFNYSDHNSRYDVAKELAKELIP